MKRILLTITFLLVSMVVFAPMEKVLYIEHKSAINYYDPLIKALVFTESRGKQTAYNTKEIAVSYFQIRPVRLRDFNQHTGKHYTMADMYVYYRAEEVFMYFTKGRDYETIARCWAGGEHGTIKATNKYWKQVKSKL